MASRITFLGTAGDASVYGRQLRSSGGIVLQVEDLQFHIDPGPGSVSQAKACGVNIRATTVVLASTNKITYCNDVNAVIEAMTLAGLDKKGIIISAKSVVLGTEGKNSYLTPYHQSLLERVICLEQGNRVGIELVEVHALSLEAEDPLAVGFKLYCPRFTLGYVPETKYSKKLGEELQGCDILILTVPVAENKENLRVLDKVTASKIIQKVKPRLAVITHFGFDMIRADPLLIARDIQQETGVQTIAAHDGLAINPDSYSAKSPQFRLASFLTK